MRNGEQGSGPSGEMMNKKISKTTYKKLVIIGVLYLAEGIPYGYLFLTLAVYFRSFGIDLKHIGLISIMSLPWSFKALWAPLVDKYGQRWHWIVSTQIIIAIQIIIIAHLDIASLPLSLWISLLVLSFAGATQDMAIDAYSIDILEPHEQGIANGVRAAAFRVAVILSGGGLIAFSGLLEKKFVPFLEYIKSLCEQLGTGVCSTPGWIFSYYCLGLLFILIAASVTLFKGFHIPKVAKQQESGKSDFLLYWYYPLKELFNRRYVIPVLFFILLFKLGDQMMSQMVYTFWFDRGFSKEEIGLISGTLGLILTILGSLLGGVLTSRWDIGKSLLILGGLQAISNLGYAAVAHFNASRYYVYSASFFESFTSGLGTAAFLAFLMRLCKKQFSATQYALLSSLFSIGGRVAPWIGGNVAQSLGYASFFAFTFLIALPAFGLLPFVVKNLKNIPVEGSGRIRSHTSGSLG